MEFTARNQTGRWMRSVQATKPARKCGHRSYRIVLSAVYLCVLVCFARDIFALDRIATRESPTGSGNYEFYVNNGTTNPTFIPQGFTELTFINIVNDFDDPLWPDPPSDPPYNWADYSTTFLTTPLADVFYDYDDAALGVKLGEMSSAGYNTVRFFINHFAHTLAAADIPPGSPRLRQAYINNIVSGIKAAQDNGMHVILCFGFIPETYESEMPAASGPQFLRPNGSPLTPIDKHNFNAYYLYPSAVQAMGHYITDVLHYTKARADSLGYANLLNTVMAIDVFNESFFLTDRPPFNLPTTVTFNHLSPASYNMETAAGRLALMDNGFKYWLHSVTQAIKNADAGAYANILLTANVYTPYSLPAAGYLDNASGKFPPRVRMVADEPNIDYVDIHLYPINLAGTDANPYSIDSDLFSAGIELAGPSRSKFSDGSSLAMPMLMSECGARLGHAGGSGTVDDYPTIAKALDGLVTHERNSSRYGFNGWLLWTWDVERTSSDPGFWNARLDYACLFNDEIGALGDLMGQYGDPRARRLMEVKTGSIPDLPGRNVMLLDDKGNMVIRAGARVASYTQPDPSMPFIVKKFDGTILLQTNMMPYPDWNVMISGGVADRENCSDLPGPLIKVKDAQNSVIMYLDTSGVMHLNGTYYDANTSCP